MIKTLTDSRPVRSAVRAGLLALLLTAIPSAPLPALPRASASPAVPAAQRFFPKADLMRIGVYYYPEQWPESEWARDLGKMAEMGFEFTHFGEFAWAFLEPSDGRFDFAWLDRAVDLAAKAGLKVILCTPTPCPPAWLGEKYPEIYLVGADGRRMEHGTRANGSLASDDWNACALPWKLVTSAAGLPSCFPAC